ncbi:MAG: RNA polymerase sigma-70 factor [Ferruginibacter sp.]
MEPKILKDLFNGDEETYVFLFKEYYVPLCLYSKKYVGCKNIAEEIVSDTFLKLWENRKLVKINTSIKAYLFRAVANNSLSYLRKMKTEDNLKQFFYESSTSNSYFSIAEDEEQGLISENLTDKIKEAVDKLSKQQQKVFKLRRFEKRKAKEVAEIMGLSVKTIEMHLSKATLRLKQNLINFLTIIPAIPLFLLARKLFPDFSFFFLFL